MPELNPVCHTVDHRPGWGPRETKGIHSPKTQERRHENNLNVHPTEIANTDSSQNTGIQYSTENGRGLLYSCAGRSRKHSGAKEASCSSQTWLVFTQFQSNKTYITVTGLELGVTSTQAVILDSFLVFWRKGQQNRNSRNTLACRQSAGKDAPQGHENCPYWTDIFFFWNSFYTTMGVVTWPRFSINGKAFWKNQVLRKDLFLPAAAAHLFQGWINMSTCRSFLEVSKHWEIHFKAYGQYLTNVWAFSLPK